MKKSSIQYEEDSLFQTKSAIVYPQIEEGWQKNTKTGELQSPASNSETQVKEQKYQNKAVKSFNKEQWGKAASNYRQAIKANSDFISPHLYKQLCRSYLKMGKSLAAGEALVPLLESHQADFGLHLLLAEIHQQSKQKDLAIKHITLAHLLNRNSPSILLRLQQIYEENDLKFLVWSFDPKYEVSSDKTGKVLVAYRESPWRAYGACKAVWENEPEYASKMAKISTEHSAIIEQKECLLNALIAFEKPEVDQNAFPEFQCLAKALTSNEINTYILYEIDARAKPMLLCQLEEVALLKVVDFVKKYHTIAIP